VSVIALTVTSLMTGRVEWVTDRTRFGELREGWDRLADGPFQRHAWYDAWWSSSSTGRRLAICTMWLTEELVAVLPLCRHGLRLEAMANVHSPVAAILRPSPRSSTPPSPQRRGSFGCPRCRSRARPPAAPSRRALGGS
jgi:CelD/BcsL family acetyltransferase involved in cellulose biosynthesis